MSFLPEPLYTINSSVRYELLQWLRSIQHVTHVGMEQWSIITFDAYLFKINDYRNTGTLTNDLNFNSIHGGTANW